MSDDDRGHGDDDRGHGGADPASDGRDADRANGDTANDAPPVREAYDRIATHFSKTREHPWPAVERFVDGAERARVALDVGCGNGRHAALLARCADRVVGVDVSLRVLAVARERARERNDAGGVEWVAGDARALPVADDRVDLALYVAAVHHLPARAARVASLDELARVLAPGGRALVSAWATTHDRFDAVAGDPGFDTTVDWTLPGGEAVPRFYHIYAPGEFRADVVSSELVVERVFVEAGNCYAVVRGPGG